ncbi:MAG TPA: uracil-DNA glycosylase [Actinomycetes bacterium]|nr:uracil-DNA glycosylase [Actinomycetes bacterium]
MSRRPTSTASTDVDAVARRHIAAAARAQDWTELAHAIEGCAACPDLVAGRSHVVVGAFPAGARLLLVGEAPGAAEDAAGLPFVGRSGALLDELLAEAGLGRDDVAITNVVRCRPPGNRTPRRAEVRRCRPWLLRQLELVDPLLVVTLGVTAAAAFFGPGARIGTLRGAVHLVAGRSVLATYHPSAALRFGPAGQPIQSLRQDLALAATVLRQTAPREESNR